MKTRRDLVLLASMTPCPHCVNGMMKLAGFTVVFCWAIHDPVVFCDICHHMMEHCTCDLDLPAYIITKQLLSVPVIYMRREHPEQS